MIWYWIAGILTIMAITLLVFNFVRERRYIKKKTSEAMSEELKKEIEEERFDALTRKQKFDDALESAKKLESDN